MMPMMPVMMAAAKPAVTPPKPAVTPAVTVMMTAHMHPPFINNIYSQTT
jgi:hypothetical protein